MENYYPAEYEQILNDISRQMAVAQLSRRQSRTSAHTTPSSHARRSVRIEKPRSNHSSPKLLERRRTTHGIKQHPGHSDYYSYGHHANTIQAPSMNTSQRLTRPVSWHPSTAQLPNLSVQDYFTGQPFINPYANLPYQDPSALAVYGQHQAYEPFQQTGFDFSSESGSSNYSRQYPTTTWSSYEDLPLADSSRSQYISYSSDPSPLDLQQQLSLFPTEQHQNANRASDSLTLPIQHPAAPEEPEESEPKGPELVGMGLYDLPDTQPNWNGFSSYLTAPTGKGLKLEESFQPPAELIQDDDDDDDDDGDESSDEAEQDEPPNLPDQQAHVPIATSNASGSLAGQSFFFDEDEGYANEWWYGQLKNGAEPARNAGVGYGWL